MGGSVVAFGHHLVCQIIVFFVLTLFVVDKKWLEILFVDLKFSKETLCGIFIGRRNEKCYDYTQIKKACCAHHEIC